jgi:hypothetical protein
VRRRALAVILAGSVAATACGGHTATKQDVIARANAICFTALQGVRSLAPPTAGSASLASLSAYLRKVVPIVERKAAGTRALPRPSQDRAVLNRYVAAVSAAETEYRALASAAARGDRAAVAQAQSALRGNAATVLATEYGLSQCAASAGTGVS